MPGIEELMAMQGGGGGAPPAPGGAPPGAGGGQGAAMAQKLGELLQDPVAMKGMMQYAQQMGLDPSMLMGGAGAAQGGPPPGPMDAPPPMAMEAPQGAPMDAEAMATDAIDGAGATWDGTDAPTQNDIDRLKAEPTDAMVESFDEHFGDGAAAAVIGEEGGEGAPAEGAPPEGEAEEY